MRFQDIPGHSAIKEKLRQMADSKRIPHALLLHGPQGVGKMQLARAFAQYINCTSLVGGDSCGVCPACRQSMEMNHPDLHYVYPTVKPKGAKMVLSSDWAAEWRTMLHDHPWMEPEAWQEAMHGGNTVAIIPVAESEEIARIASLSSYASDFKIFIIWQAEKMNESAANKLLKLLEEPFADTLFILVSNHPDQLLPTIYSRLQRLEVGRLSDSEIASRLVADGVSPEDATLIARRAQGSPGRAFQLVSVSSENEEFSGYFREIMRNAYAMKGQELKLQSETFAGMGREKGMRLLGYIASQIRENFIYNLRTPGLNVMSRSEEEFSRRFSPFIHVGNVETMIAEVDTASRALSQNANAKITWFDFLLRMMRALRIPAPK
ncbi:MAG: DNA polymerase III subunit delta' [Muribaculaceae bacterium]|nr:DNA polymerase III subunit delta' [Muribaculaceae bacterium]